MQLLCSDSQTACVPLEATVSLSMMGMSSGCRVERRGGGGMEGAGQREGFFGRGCARLEMVRTLVMHKRGGRRGGGLKPSGSSQKA